MKNYVDVEGLKVSPLLVAFIKDEATPGTGITPEAFWKNFAALIHDLAPENRDTPWMSTRAF